MKRKVTQKGITLIEVLLYVVLVVVIVGSVVVFLGVILESRVKQGVSAGVEEEGSAALTLILERARIAEGINTPAVGATGSTLSLDAIAAGDDPTVFNLLSGVLQITEGGGNTVAITSSEVVASNLTIDNLSRADTPGVVRVSFTLSSLGVDGRQEFSYVKTFYGTASLRVE